MDPLPIPGDTNDLRHGPDLHPDLLPLLPLVGTWRGQGKGGYPTIKDFDYGQEVTFAHDGRPFLFYESRSWLLDADGKVVRPAAREAGWWRPNGTEAFELVLAHPSGIAEIYVGKVNTTTQWECSTDVVARTESAKDVVANHRLYGIVDRALLYAIDMTAMGQPSRPHLSARLERVAG